MNKLLRFLLLMMITVISSCNVTKKITTCKPATFNLERIEKNVQRQFKAALEDLKNGSPSITLVPKEASLTLAITDQLSGSGGLEVLIVQGSYKYVQAKKSTVTFSYTDNTDRSGGGGLNDDTATIKNLIIKAARDFNTLSSIGTLKKDNFEIEISFSIEKTTSGGFKFTIWGADVNATAEKDCTVEQTLKLKFEMK